MKKLLATLVVMSLLAALAISAATASGSGSGEARTAAKGTIRLKDNRFVDGSLDIKRGVLKVRKGRRVTFVWRGDNPHNVTGFRKRKRVFQSRTTDRRGFKYRKRFKRDTRIVCTVHPSTMRFKVDVRGR